MNTCPYCRCEVESKSGSCALCGNTLPGEGSTDFSIQDILTSAAAPTLAQTPLFPTARLLVLRGARVDIEYKLLPGPNVIGRAAIPDVDIDLADQELPDIAMASRRHAIVRTNPDTITVEDLSSLNGTLVNRTRLVPGQATEIHTGDVVQIGSVLLKLVSDSGV
ncbi:MAG TPA: FHA domain-containing protein [Fimbriiglobus sp.]